MEVLGIKDGSSVLVREKRKDRRKKCKVFTGFKIGFMITEPNFSNFFARYFYQKLRMRQKSRRTENVGKLSKDAPVPTLLLSGKIETCRYFSRSLGPNLPRMVIFLSSPNCYDVIVDLEAKTDKHNSNFLSNVLLCFWKSQFFHDGGRYHIETSPCVSLILVSIW